MLDDNGYPLPESRNSKILAYVEAHPDASYREIATVFGVKRQWVGYLAIKAGLRRRRGPFFRGPFFRICQVCGDRKQVKGRRQAVSRRCRQHPERRKTLVLTLKCDLCGTIFTRSSYSSAQHLEYQRIQIAAGKTPKTICPSCFPQRRFFRPVGHTDL